MPDEPKPRWLLTCSGGWVREASSAWAATAIARLHTRHLTAPGTEHTIPIEEPADPDAPRQSAPQLA